MTEVPKTFLIVFACLHKNAIVIENGKKTVSLNSHEIRFQRVISRFRNRKGNWSSFVNLLHNRWIVHSPLFFRKMVEIKRVPLREAIPPSPTSIKPRRLTHTSVHLKPKWPPVMLSARSRRSYGKIGVCRNSLIKRKN